ncbi:NAD(P)H-hydrate dehydratase [Allosphingosinicella flava]|uniref:Bifunctional NAD(P)H-hydrate repair enzyme n=2 Tax=Allosphingosinicella flava TaxID=2771430 RepID=A0A7T2GLU0_9SPHN|nr:NAD(P)H-hydrate dehydratase [Sphingosinicella flava]
MRSADPILTAAEMRAAEEAAVAADTPARALMERAGQAAAAAIRAFAGPLPALILCGPGNNGGDGYVIARRLAEAGVDVRIAVTGDPVSQIARDARAAWSGSVEPIEAAESAPLLIDALFGTGLSRPLDAALSGALLRLAGEARVKAAVDLPSGVASDDGAILSPVPDFDMTVTFGALKPSHLLQPAARHVGRIVLADIGIAARSNLSRIGRPLLSAPGPDEHKYDRGYVSVVGGEMPGAAALCASAAMRAGAGYVRLIADAFVPDVPQAVVQSPLCSGAGRSPAAPKGETGLRPAPEHNDDVAALLADPRVNALLAGPGLGRSGRSRSLLHQAIEARHPLILDADALNLVGEDWGLFSDSSELPILTPHGGEFARLFGTLAGSKVEQARAAAVRANAVILLKGADTVVAGPDGRAAISAAAPAWLATAGTGDVLAGIVAAMRARGMPPFEAACAAVWLHGRAAELAGPFLIADDLIGHLGEALRECL